jgi:hypothetical protein
MYPPMDLVNDPDGLTQEPVHSVPILRYLHRTPRLTAALSGRSPYHSLSVPAPIFAREDGCEGRKQPRPRRTAIDDVQMNDGRDSTPQIWPMDMERSTGESPTLDRGLCGRALDPHTVGVVAPFMRRNCRRNKHIEETTNHPV